MDKQEIIAMKKILLFLSFSLFFAFPTKADIASKRLLSEQDLQKPYFELWLMKNDIFARKGYRFSSSELQTYYERQIDYKAVADNNQIVLSEIEKQNVSLLQARLDLLTSQRKQIAEQLRPLRKLDELDTKVEMDMPFEEGAFVPFHQLLHNIDLEALAKSGLSRIVIDNGELELSYLAEIKEDNLTLTFQKNLSTQPSLKLSEEEEWMVIWHFQLVNGKLTWRKTNIVG